MGMATPLLADHLPSVPQPQKCPLGIPLLLSSLTVNYGVGVANLDSSIKSVLCPQACSMLGVI